MYYTSVDSKAGKEILYTFFSGVSKNSIAYFRINILLDAVTEKRFKIFNKVFVLANDDLNTLAIINKSDEFCSVFSNEDFDDSIHGFLEELFKKRRFFTYISCDSIMSEYLYKYIKEEHILSQNNITFYEQTVGNILKSDISDQFKLEFNEDKSDYIIEFMKHPKKLDDNTIQFFNDYFDFFICVDNASSFIDKYFKNVYDNYGYIVEKNVLNIDESEELLNDIKMYFVLTDYFDYKKLEYIYISDDLNNDVSFNNVLKTALSTYSMDLNIIINDGMINLEQMKSLNFIKKGKTEYLFFYNYKYKSKNYRGKVLVENNKLIYIVTLLIWFSFPSYRESIMTTLSASQNSYSGVIIDTLLGVIIFLYFYKHELVRVSHNDNVIYSKSIKNSRRLVKILFILLHLFILAFVIMYNFID